MRRGRFTGAMQRRVGRFELPKGETETFTVDMATLEYAPGESSAGHRHNAHVFVYVRERSVAMQVKGGQEVRHLPQSGWLDELGRLKGGRLWV